MLSMNDVDSDVRDSNVEKPIRILDRRKKVLKKRVIHLVKGFCGGTIELRRQLGSTRMK